MRCHSCAACGLLRCGSPCLTRSTLTAAFQSLTKRRYVVPVWNGSGRSVRQQCIMHLRELIGQAPTRDLGWLIRDALPATSALDASPDPIPTGVPVAVRSQKRLEALRGIDSRERWAKQHAYPIALRIGSAHACGVVGLRTLKSNMFVSGQTPHTAIRVAPATSRGVKLYGAFEAPSCKDAWSQA